MIGLREDQRERGELLAMIRTWLPIPCRHELAREKGKTFVSPLAPGRATVRPVAESPASKAAG